MRQEEANMMLEGCIYKYGPLANFERTINDTTLGFNSLFDYNDIYEHDFQIVHYFNSLEEQKAIFATPGPYADPLRLIDERLTAIKVTCFSGTATNNLMWSHYADKHKGVVYCFHKRSEERRVGKEGRSRWSPYH